MNLSIEKNKNPLFKKINCKKILLIKDFHYMYYNNFKLEAIPPDLGCKKN